MAAIFARNFSFGVPCPSSSFPIWYWFLFSLYDEGGVYQTFRTEQEAEKYAGMLNRKETEPGRPDEAFLFLRRGKPALVLTFL